MSKFNSLNEIANAYVKANRLKSEGSKKQVKSNFINNWDNFGIEISSVEFVDFDSICIVVDDELIDIEM